MRQHLQAIRDAWAADFPVDLWQPSPGRQLPFASIEAPGWAADPDQPVCGPTDAFEVEIRVRVVAGTPEGVAIMLDRARSALPGALVVAGRRASLRWARSEFIALDLDTTTPQTNRHPAYGIDTYTLTSQPL